MDLTRAQQFEAYAHRVLRSSVVGVKRVTDVLRKPAKGLPENPETILVVRLWGLAPFLCATPTLAALRTRYPSSRITLLTTQSLANLYRDGELYDHVMTWDAEGLSALPSSIRRFRDAARAEEFDLAINLDFLSDMAALLTHASGSRTTTGFVRRGESRRGYTLPVPLDESLPAIECFAGMAKALNADTGDLAVIPPKLTSGETLSAEETLGNWGVDEHTHLVGVCMDASEEAVQRAWPPEKHVLLAQAIEEVGGYKTVFFGAPSEERFVSRHVKQMATHPINLAGRTSLRQFAALFTKMHLVVASTVGASRLASTVGIPTLSILFPEAAHRYALPESEKHCIVLRDSDPAEELPLDTVRVQLNDMLDHLADPENPPWMEGE